MKKRILSAVLVMVMLVSTFSVFSLAASAGKTTDIENLKANDVISVGKYDSVKKTYSFGKITIIEKTVKNTQGKYVTYPVLDGTSFVQESTDVPESTKNDLKLIEQAVNEVFVERKNYMSYSPFGNIDSMSAPYSLTVSPYAVAKLEKRGISNNDYIWLAVGNKAGKVQSVFTSIKKASETTVKYTISDELYAKGVRFENSDEQGIVATHEDAININKLLKLNDADGKQAKGFYWKNNLQAIGYEQGAETTLPVNQAVSVIDSDKSTINDMTFKAGSKLEFVAETFDINIVENGERFIEVAKYDIAKKAYTIGQMKIVRKNTNDTKGKPVSYYVLKAESFVETANEVPEKSKTDLTLIGDAVNGVFVERKKYISYSPFGNVDSKSAPYSLTISPYAVPKLEEKGMNPDDYIWLAVGNRAGKVLTVFTNIVEEIVEEPVNVPVESIFTSHSQLYVKAGSSKNVSAEINPIDATNQNVTWTVADSNIARIEFDGLNCKIIGVTKGSTIVTVTSEDGAFTQTIKVTVTEEILSGTGEFYVESMNTSFDINNTIAARIKVTNMSDNDVSLKDLKLEYYYYSDGNKNEIFVCDWAGNNHRDITPSVLGTPYFNTELGTSIVEIGFADDSEVLKPSETLEIHYRVHTDIWADYDISNDYSQGASEYQYTDKILLYHQNELVSGKYDGEPENLIYGKVVVESMNTTFGINNTISGRVKITNNTDKEFDLKDLRVEYLYNNDGNSQEVFNCDWAGLNNLNIKSLIKGKTELNNDYYSSIVEITFKNDHKMLKPSETLEVHFRVNTKNWANFDMSNDYSMGTDQYQETDRILVFYEDALIAGKLHK